MTTVAADNSESVLTLLSSACRRHGATSWQTGDVQRRLARHKNQRPLDVFFFDVDLICFPSLSADCMQPSVFSPAVCERRWETDSLCWAEEEPLYLSGNRKNRTNAVLLMFSCWDAVMTLVPNRWTAPFDAHTWKAAKHSAPSFPSFVGFRGLTNILSVNTGEINAVV